MERPNCAMVSKQTVQTQFFQDYFHYAAEFQLKTSAADHQFFYLSFDLYFFQSTTNTARRISISYSFLSRTHRRQKIKYRAQTILYFPFRATTCIYVGFDRFVSRSVVVYTGLLNTRLREFSFAT